MAGRKAVIPSQQIEDAVFYYKDRIITEVNGEKSK
jgi:hypothetical protein